MIRTKVGVLRGGTSSEYDLSLKTGASILAALPEEKYETRDILIDKQGTWHSRGMPSTPARALTQIDVVLNAVHGGIGEDGTIGRILARSGVPFAGSVPYASALAFHKGRAREALMRSGIRMPQGLPFSVRDRIDTGEMARAVFALIPPPYIVKPFSEGASHGIRIARTIIELPDVIGDVLDAYGGAVVEEFIRGHEVSVGLIEGFRGEKLYVLPPAHTIMPGMTHPDRRGWHFITPESHRDASLTHKVPSSFTHQEKRALADIARRAHLALGLGAFSRADVILTPRGPYLLEVNTIPGLYPGASFPHMLESVGSSVREFAEHAIMLARR
ncbi:ATP-grasp domain-containing protein [Candidatus Kaiserbacteria bacterium]|nr:ATP-grasp domain-containing protein [Candidatus Kaiserbacteria bacterium]